MNAILADRLGTLLSLSSVRIRVNLWPIPRLSLCEGLGQDFQDEHDAAARTSMSSCESCKSCLLAS